MTTKKSSINVWLIVCICLLVANFAVMLGIWATGGNIQRLFSGFPTFSVGTKGYYSKFDKFAMIDELLQHEYLDQAMLSGAKEEMIERALQAYVAGLDDPYTTYLTAEENTQLQNLLHDEIGISGIGAVVEKKDTYIQISEVIKNGPAYKAGLLPLDRVLYIETGSTKDLSNSEAVALIRGEKGTPVHLTIQRIEKDESSTTFDVEIIRDNIEIPSVVAKSLTISGHHVGYFSVSSISDQTTKLFVNELLELIDEHLDGMILDLRGNGGGYLEEAVKFLGHFIPKKEVVVTSEYYGYEPVFFSSQGRGELAELPLVVLVDQMTASAGEIIALALQERGILVIGMPTFGKGNIQSVETFPDHSSLKFTVGKWFSPNHVNVSGTGLIPDIEVKRDAELYDASQIDNQLERAKEELFTLMDA